jgi:hypothetical protein
MRVYVLFDKLHDIQYIFKDSEYLYERIELAVRKELAVKNMVFEHAEFMFSNDGSLYGVEYTINSETIELTLELYDLL